MDMKVRPMTRACLCSSSRVFNPNSAQDVFVPEQLPYASIELYQEFEVGPARANERPPRFSGVRRRRSAGALLSSETAFDNFTNKRRLCIPKAGRLHQQKFERHGGHSGCWQRYDCQYGSLFHPSRPTYNVGCTGFGHQRAQRPPEPEAAARERSRPGAKLFGKLAQLPFFTDVRSCFVFSEASRR